MITTRVPRETSLSADLERHRKHLWGVCYRVTGVAADADELVQETFLRALTTPPEDSSRELLPWLVRVAINASRDRLRKRKQQVYRGPWLPSPIESEQVIDHAETPAARYTTLESVSYAFMLALEALTATQRAIVILRDVLDYSVEETAEALEMSQGNVKTAHHRARALLERYEEQRPSFDAEQKRLAHGAMTRFFAHVALRDLEGLERMLRADVVGLNDGAGEFFAAQRPLLTPHRVARFYMNASHKSAVIKTRTTILGGLPAVVATTHPFAYGAPPRNATLFEVTREGTLSRIFTVVATRKIQHLFPALKS